MDGRLLTRRRVRPLFHDRESSKANRSLPALSQAQDTHGASIETIEKNSFIQTDPLCQWVSTLNERNFCRSNWTEQIDAEREREKERKRERG